MRHNILHDVRADEWSLGRHTCRFLQQLGLDPAGSCEMLEARALAADLISPDIATAATFVSIQQHTGGAALHLFREDGQITGVLGFAPLSQKGFRALIAETFDAVDPPPEHLAGAGDYPAACYGWGIAGSSPAARKALVAATIALYAEIFPDIPWFSRGATL